ncbi:MAG TPA: transglycosylase domain-containing protein [Rhizobacter sp.]|nr:transglycosylase domain-containing protein [Rhizobacter sp.]
MNSRLRLALRVFVLDGVLGACLLAAYVGYLLRTSPDASELREAGQASPSVLLAADGTVLTSFGRAQQQRVSLAQVSPHVLQALLATEDRRFYEHHGVDLQRTLSALFHTATGRLQGGSTITQQLARNLFPEEIGRSRSVHRKFKELVTALRIERLYTKQQILEIYLNTAPFLYNAVGIEMAARTYWDKPAAELSALESATLVGMLKGSHYYNPVLFPERARARRNVVLAQMVKQEMLTPALYALLSEQPLRLNFNRQAENLGSAPHFAVHARKWLLDWAEAHDVDLYTDGLQIETTLDTRLQQAAEQAVAQQMAALQHVADVEWSQARLADTAGGLESYAQRRARAEPFAHFWKQRPELLAAAVRESPEFRKALDAGTSQAEAWRRLNDDPALLARLKAQKTRLEAGFVAMDPATGEVKAWVGSRDFGIDQYDHVAQAERQPGSTFKPFVYGAALESGLSPERGYLDEAVEFRSSGGTTWRPTDMAGASGTAMSLRDGLVYSKNTITAQVMHEVGVPSVVSLARAAGVNQSRLDPVPSLALGTSPVTLLEMVNAYATIAQEGQYHAPVFVKRIRDRHGKVLAEFGPAPKRAMSQDTALELIDMMRGVVSRGTGTLVRTRFGISADVAGKTGTTQNNTDGWFILMHPSLVAGAWVGFNDSRVTMRSNYWGQGGHNAILLVGQFFRDTLKAGLVDRGAQFAKVHRIPPAVADREAGAALMRLEVTPMPAEHEPQGHDAAQEETDRLLANLSDNPPRPRATPPVNTARSEPVPVLRVNTGGLASVND